MENKCNSVFSFYISKKNIGACDLSKVVPFGTYVIQTEERTPFISCCIEHRQLVILGLCVDVVSGQSELLAEHILNKAKSLSEIIEQERYLGGKYVLFYREGESCYCLPDATASIPVYYTYHAQGPCSSHKYRLTQNQGWETDAEMMKIRRCGELSQAMPYDYTEYKEVRQLLPNHFLKMATGEAVRFVNQKNAMPVLTPDEAAEITQPMICNLAAYYLKCHTVCCPITSGRDSRVVLAALRTESAEPICCYTIRLDSHNGNEQDLTIPQEITTSLKIPYVQIREETVPDQVIREMDAKLGHGLYSQWMLRVAYTIYTHYGAEAVINGDIIGQVGKCSLHRDIPEKLATPGYFRCKLHNYSREAKIAIAQWLTEIRGSREQVNVFDLFSIENRMGRWASQENAIYNALGQLYLNIFNSRAIIYPWTRVDRGLRKKSEIHLSLLAHMEPKLGRFPFEKDESILISFSKKNGLTYYFASYLKYWIQKCIFTLKRGRKTDG